MQGRTYTSASSWRSPASVRLCADDAIFAQLEIARGIFPFGGSDSRAPAQLGQSTMRFLLTAEPFGAAEALRIGLVQEIVSPGALLDRAIAIAQTIAAQAPRGVRATLASAWLAAREGEQAAARALRAEIVALMATDDAREGLQSFVERRVGNFSGK